MKRLLIAILFASLAILHSSSVAGQRPNVVFILADDLGVNDVGLYGSKFHETPNIDALAKRGVKFNRAYSASPLCSPTRSSIMTGLYPARTGITAPDCHLPKAVLDKHLNASASPAQKALGAESVTRLATSYHTLAKAFKAEGYATAHFGKWHLGPEPFSPLQHGFDSDIPHTSAPSPLGKGFFFPFPVWKNHGKPGDNLEDLVCDEAVKFIEQHREQPFFLNYWAFEVHSPWQAKDRQIDKYRAKADPKSLQRNPVYAGMIDTLDEVVGRLVATLEKAGVLNNTIIVFTSDNGPYFIPNQEHMPAEFHKLPVTSAQPLRAGKGTIYEAGTRVPLVVVWPGKGKPGTETDALVQSTDFFPTFADLLGWKLPGEVRFDGISLRPVLERNENIRDEIFCHFPHTQARGEYELMPAPTPATPASSVRQGDWKLIRLYCENADQTDRHELYNLAADPGERHDLAAAQPERVKQLAGRIDQFLKDTAAVIPKPNPAYQPGASPTKAKSASAEDRLFLDNGTVKVGIDRTKGAAITWLSSADYPKNLVNVTDPGRLIQQSYYSGKILDRRADGQHAAWSPWSWNPIQGGGVGSWARVNDFKRIEPPALYSETVPKLWDMPNEEAAALMRQWTAFEPAMPNAVVVRCEFVSQRADDDRWGAAVRHAQEIPACYFTRNFSAAKSYLGDGQWRDETQPPGPPWGKAHPPLNAMAFFTAEGQGVAVFSPAATQPWNFGPHGEGTSDDPVAGPCMHVAPLDRVSLGPKSIYRFRYWLILGTAPQLATRLDELLKKYSHERAELAGP